MRRPRNVIRRPAIIIKQNTRYPLYLFALTGEEIQQIADVSRIARDQAGRLIGYQRPEVRKHIQNIVNYLNSDDILLPNSIIMSLSRDVKFCPNSHRGESLSQSGVLEIPISKKKPGWIVDGQQRAVALTKTQRRHFPVPVNAFIADDVGLQRDQFLRVNSTKPLPRGLITELLPTVETVLPVSLTARRVPSALCDLLNDATESPFNGLIRRSSMTEAQRKRAVVTDTAIIQMIQESLTSPSGCLFPYRNLATGQTDMKGLQLVLFAFWQAVKETWPDAWGLPPAQSRLMHGAGIRAMGKLMDRLMASVDMRDARAAGKVRKCLSRMKKACSWTNGTWVELGNMEWNEIQNVPGHIRMLANYLVRLYFEISREVR